MCLSQVTAKHSFSRNNPVPCEGLKRIIIKAKEGL